MFFSTFSGNKQKGYLPKIPAYAGMTKKEKPHYKKRIILCRNFVRSRLWKAVKWPVHAPFGTQQEPR